MHSFETEFDAKACNVSLQFDARNDKFSKNDQFRLTIISLCRILEVAWGALGSVLDLKGGTERNFILFLN